MYVSRRMGVPASPAVAPSRGRGDIVKRVRELVVLLSIVIVFAAVAGWVVGSNARVDVLEDRIAELERDRTSSATAGDTGTLTVEQPGGPAITFEDSVALADEVVAQRRDLDAIGYALERDIHRNPALLYWLAETHAVIDRENDPLPYLTHEELMHAQASKWNAEPYLAFPYEVTYPGGQD